MFINENVVAVLFRLINFGAVIGCATYVFKKYLKQDILNTIQSQKEIHDYLYVQQASFEKQQSDLNTFLQAEIVECKKFKSKIDEWKRVVTLEQEQEQIGQTYYQLSLKKRAGEIAANRQAKNIQRIVSQAVGQNLEKSLSEHFQDAEKNADYINAIVQFMEEKVS